MGYNIVARKVEDQNIRTAIQNLKRLKNPARTLNTQKAAANFSFRAVHLQIENEGTGLLST